MNTTTTRVRRWCEECGDELTTDKQKARGTCRDCEHDAQERASWATDETTDEPVDPALVERLATILDDLRAGRLTPGEYRHEVGVALGTPKGGAR